MKFKTTVYFALMFLANGVSAQSLYLTCQNINYPDLNFKTIYKVMPANARNQFIEDMIIAGHYAVLGNKSESWAINLPERHISSADGKSKYDNAVVTGIRISASERSPTGIIYSYDLNRITGKLIHEIVLTTEATKAWHQKHGGKLPTIWRWEQICTAASQTKI